MAKNPFKPIGGRMIKRMYEAPPYEYLVQAADHCPKAISTYLLIWREADKNRKVHVYKKDVLSAFLTPIVKFKNDLMKLVKEGLISVEETPKSLLIELVGWDEEE